ncbi:MAG: ABC transporter ATP-binding protein [Bacillota bacterium]|nr:ABC transporter ATP-binding protein [Bacillota bacterium]
MRKSVKKPNVYMRLLSYLKPGMAKMIVAIFVILIGVVTMALAPLLMGFAINILGEILGGNHSNELIQKFLALLIAMGGCYVANSLLVLIGNNLVVAVTQKAVYTLRKEIDEKLQLLPLNYYDTTSYGDILSRLTNDVDTVSNSLQSSIFQVVNALFTVIIVFWMMMGISGFLTFLGLITVPILVIISAKISIKSQEQFDKQMAQTGDLNGLVEETYSGHNVISVFGKEEFVENIFDDENTKLYKSSQQGQYLAALLFPISTALNNVSYILVCIVGAIIAILGGLSIGMIQTFATYLQQFTEPISEVMQITGIVQTTGAAATRIFEFLDEKEEVKDVEQPQFPKELKGAVQFDHVKFGYLPHQTLIHDLDIKINAGEKTAIVGPTGAGKSTLVNLIMRFYDVKGGAIRIDGVNIRDMPRSELRKIFGMVLQDTWLYSGTIMENIRYGRLDATDEEVIQACKAARADAFIRTLPGGYNFVLSEGASNIAQGQRQLLTIARAMLADSPIMILDEATSSVDTRTEVLIQEAMNNMMKGRTSFIIAHRLSTIKDADNILYMQDGDILEVGNHDSLMAKNGLYAKLYNSQFSNE